MDAHTAGRPTAPDSGSVRAALLLFTLLFLLVFVVPSGAAMQDDFDWFNTTWQHRVGIDTVVDVEGDETSELENWPVEREMNFTALFEDAGTTGTFDEDSIRVFEYDGEGNILYEQPHQFDKDAGFDAESNAAGELVWMLNGTTEDEDRRFFVYFDTVENGPKDPVTYDSDLGYEVDGEMINITTTRYEYAVDTNRGDGTSGIVQAVEQFTQFGQPTFEVGETERTAEYLDYSNETHGFTFDLSGSMDVPEDGPLRLTMDQEGYRTFYDVPGTDEDLMVEKTYRFYENAGPLMDEDDEDNSKIGFVKVEHRIVNTGDEEVSLVSDGQGLRFDPDRTLFGDDPAASFTGDETEPWSWFVGGTGAGRDFEFMVGMVNLFSDPVTTSVVGTVIDDVVERIGLETASDTITLQPDESFQQESFVSVVGHGTRLDRFQEVQNMFEDQPDEIQHDVETYDADIDGDTAMDEYNRDETVDLDVDVLDDPYDVVDAVNVTLGPDTAEDSDGVDLSETEPGVWEGTYDIADDAEIGEWEAEFSAYTEDDVFVTSDLHTFDVTDELEADLVVEEDVQMEGEPMSAELTVENVREDRMITGADVSCEYEHENEEDGGSVDPENITEVEDGVYDIDWTAPSPAGEWDLTCTAESGGNVGEDTDGFWTEVAQIVPTTELIPDTYLSDNVTVDGGDVFDFVADLTNDEDGTAYTANISVAEPGGWSVNVTEEECGDVPQQESCEAPFQVSIPDGTVPGTYDVNVTTEWINPDGSANETGETLDVTVSENPVLDIDEDAVAGEVAGGFAEEIGTFTVDSIGNFNLSDVSVMCEEGEVCQDFDVSFDPDHVENMDVDDSETVVVEVSVPQHHEPGEYTGEINVSSEGSWDTLDITVDVTAETTVETETIPETDLAVENITQEDGETFRFDVNSTNTGDAFAYVVNQSITFSEEDWSTNASTQECGTLNVSESCTNTFFVAVPAGTEPSAVWDEYTVTAETEWRNPNDEESTTDDELGAEVTSNPVQNVPEDTVSGEVPAGGFSEIGAVTLESVGNDDLTDIDYVCEEGSGAACDDFDLSFTPENLGEIEPGDDATITVNVSVPEQYPAGSYSGELNVSSDAQDGTQYDTVDIDVDVPITRSWELEPMECFGNTEDAEVCTPALENTGNAPINLSIDPQAVNNTNVSETWFEIELGETEAFDVMFDTDADQSVTHEAMYNVSSDNEDALTRWRPLDVTVFPAEEPDINVSVTPDEFMQNGTARIRANVSSGTEFPIEAANTTVTMPTGDVFEERMALNRTYNDGDVGLWELYYPDDINDTDANATMRGLYDVDVTAEDEVGNTGLEQDNFTVTTFINETLRTMSDSYLQGDRGTIEYRVQDLFGHGIPDVQVNFSIDSEVLPFPLVNEENPFTTVGDDEDGGYTATLPSFDLNDDFDAGIYTLAAEAQWYDEVLDRTEELEQSQSFTVEEEGLLDITWDPGAVWHPEANMTMYATVSEAGSLQDADDISMTVYDPEGNQFFSNNASEFRNPVEGVYQTWHEIGDDPEFGMYWAEMAVEKDDESTVEYQSFRIAEEEVVKGPGPFDLNVSMLEHEVEQGDQAFFNLSFINMGNESGDAHIRYWVEQNDSVYAEVTESIFSPSRQAIVVPRSANIFSNQPLGEYTLHAEIQPLGDVGGIPTATASMNFMVVEDTDEEPPDPEEIVEEEEEVRTLPPEPEPPDPVHANMSIADAPQEINLARGQPEHLSVTMANIGDRTLENVSLNMVGLPPEIPVTITPAPDDPQEIPTEATETYAIGIEPSADVDTGQYNATFVGSSAQLTLQEDVTVQVFESMEERIRAELERVAGQTTEVELEMERLEEQGIDVADVRTLVEEIEVLLDSADTHLEEDRPEDALQDIEDAEDLIVEAERQLDRKTVPERLEVFELLPAVVGGVVLLAAILVLFYVVRVRHVKPWEVVQDRLHDAAIQAKKKKMKEEEDLIEEKQKTQRLLELLDAQHEEGIMDDDSYEEMKQSAEEKLRRINKKLEDNA